MRDDFEIDEIEILDDSLENNEKPASYEDASLDEVDLKEIFKEAPPQPAKPIDFSDDNSSNEEIIDDSLIEEITIDEPPIEKMITEEPAVDLPKAEMPDEEIFKEETQPLNKDDVLGKTYNLSEELKEVVEEPEIDDKNSVTFIAFLFAFLVLFVLALPFISRIFS